MDTGRASLNSITLRHAPLDQLIALAVDQGFGGVGLWRDSYEGIGASGAARMIVDAGLRVTSVCRGGMFTHTSEAQRRAAREDNRRAVEETARLGADCLVLVCGGAPDGDLARARAQIEVGVDDLAAFAADHGVRLAIEPMNPMMVADRSAITSLGEANDLLDMLGHPHLGITLDAYHVFWDVHLEREIARAGDRIQSVQVCDWVLPIHHQLSSRGMPGEGSIRLTEFVEAATRAGYEGLIEVEVLSDDWWARSPEDAAAAAARGVREI